MKIKGAVFVIVLMILSQGCSSSCQSELDSPPKTIFTGNQPVHIVVSTTPYEISKSTLDSIQLFFKKSLGLQTKVSKLDLEISKRTDLTKAELFNASKKVLERAKMPTVVIITLKKAKGFGGYGWITAAETSYDNAEKYPVGVVTFIRKDFIAEKYEWLTITHEIGHWIGVPARGCHIYKDGAHCSNLRCLMTSGPGSNMPRWLCSVGLSIVFLSPPDFCDDCKRELAEMKKLHSQVTCKTKTKLQN